MKKNIVIIIMGLGLMSCGEILKKDTTDNRAELKEVESKYSSIDDVEEIKITPSKITVDEWGSLKLEAHGVFPDKTSAVFTDGIEWKSDNPDIVKISNTSGALIGVKKGAAKITAKIKDLITTVDVTVNGSDDKLKDPTNIKAIAESPTSIKLSWVNSDDKVNGVRIAYKKVSKDQSEKHVPIKDCNSENSFSLLNIKDNSFSTKIFPLESDTTYEFIICSLQSYNMENINLVRMSDGVRVTVITPKP